MSDDITKTPTVPGLSSDDVEALVRAANAVFPNAYAPYSQFPVAAAILCDPDHINTGINVENASFPLGSCAERTAIGKAITAGHRQFRAIVIVTGSDRLVAPCGACRQLLAEFADELPIILKNSKGDYRVVFLTELLPDRFGPDDLGP
ncbi:MAG: cytidine deaminase [Myxococcales bacterium]|nr:cytidine deaminase [Myxococcales bacterium]